MRGVCCVVFVLIFTVLPARAATTQEVLQSQEETVGVEELEDAAKDAGGEAVYGESLDQGLNRLLETGNEELGGVIRRGVRSGVILLVILLVCSLGQTLYQVSGKEEIPAVTLAGTLGVTAAAVADVSSLVGMGRSAIEEMSAFATVLLPTVAGATAATGAVAGAAARQLAAAVFSTLLVKLIQGLLIPLVYGYLAASVAWSALGNPGLRHVASLLKWMVTTVLTIVMMVFVGYLTISGVVAGSVDGVSVKVAKFAISGAIPVVGGILADASETILASAGILKGAVGVFGMVTVLGICLLPILRLSVHYLLYKLVSAVAASLGQSRVCGLVEQIGGAFGLVLGMTGACCLLLLVTLVSSVSAVVGL